jgi:tyrosine-protein phosphatase SIW14
MPFSSAAKKSMLKFASCFGVALCLFSAFLGISLAGMAYSFEQGQPFVHQDLLNEASLTIPNLATVSPELIRGGQPTPQGLSSLRAAGIKTIINLRNEEVLVAQEARMVHQLGMRYINIPLDVFDEPSPSDVNKFLQAVRDPANKPVFVHCLHGQDRTGTFVGIYRVAEQGWPQEKAYAEMLSMGFRPAFTNLSRALFDFGRLRGQAAEQPSPKEILTDLKERLFKMLKR